MMTAEGYAGDRVASTVVLIRDGGKVIVVDPGIVAHLDVMLDPLRALKVDPPHRHRRDFQSSPPRPHTQCRPLSRGSIPDH
jgi:hypothetical protein